MVQGIASLSARLKRVRAEVEAAAKRRTKDGADVIASQTRVLAPKDQGDLIATVRVEPLTALGKGSRRADAIGFKVIYGDETTLVPLKDGSGTINNAILQELGTHEMAANPALLPAYRANRSRIRAAIARDIRKALLRP